MLQKYSLNKDYYGAATAKYPYAYARVSAMRSFLLRKQDYHKMLKMSLSEATSFLESTIYKREIDELSVRYKGIDLIEIALNKNMANTYTKLRRISKKLVPLLDAYLLRKDISNFKIIARAKYTKEENYDYLLQPYFLNWETLNELMKKTNIEEMLKSSRILKPEEASKVAEKFKETNRLIEVENALDQHYYNELTKVVEKLPRKATKFKAFLEQEIETLNILNLFRFKKEGMEKKEIKKYLIPQKKSTLIKKLADAEMHDTGQILEATGYGAIAKNGLKELKEKGTLAFLEIDLYKNLLSKALQLSGTNPLMGDSILTFLFAKEIETRNLKLILKSKQLGLPQEFIEEQIIM